MADKKMSLKEKELRKYENESTELKGHLKYPEGPKKWFRVAKTSAQYKWAVEFGKFNDKDAEEDCKYPISRDAQSQLPDEFNRQCWEVELYKMIGMMRYVVMVEYDNLKYLNLKIKAKGKKISLVGVEVNVDYPKEFAEGGGGGFDGGGGFGGFGGTKDGIMKSLGAFSSSNAVKLGKVKYKKKPKIKAPKKLASGHNLYSAMGTKEIKTREFKAGASKSSYDASKEENFVTAEMAGKVEQVFDKLVEQIGEVDGGLDGNAGIGKIPAADILRVLDGCGDVFKDLNEMQRKRVQEMGRFDKDSLIEVHQVIDIINRVYNEAKQGHFHMTVRELQDLFNDHDLDFSGQLEAKEISSILNKVHMVVDIEQVKSTMREMDQDDDAALDFEEFMTLCQKMYKERGGVVVANRCGPCSFNQTRVVIDSLREKVERHHLMITQLKATLENFEEQLEVMNTISQHSALQAELNKTREEKKRLAKLHGEMEMQNRAWLRDIKQIHGREKRDAGEKIKFIEKQTEEANAALKYAKENYENDYADAMQEVEEVMQSLNAVLEFTQDSERVVEVDIQHSNEMRKEAQLRLGKYKLGRKGTVWSPSVYDSAAAIHAFLQNKTSALEKWLISRTQFTQADREKYLKRVEEVKKKREEYEINRIELTKQLGIIEKKIKTKHKEVDEITKKNVDLRDKLDDPTARTHDEGLAKKLTADLETIQVAISSGHREKLQWTRKLYPKEHELHMERHKISLLQIELGELKVLLEDIEHHGDITVAAGRR